MSEYDYKQGKNRVESILDNRMEIEEKDKLPRGDNFTFENGYLSWITAIFVDIRGSSSIFASDDKQKVAKLIRSFTSEIIEILRDNPEESLVREIGIRGDCVYAIYTTPKKEDVYTCANKTFYINTFVNMFNKLLSKRGYSELRVGIGMATDKELVIKAGRKSSGINSKVWIGKAVTMASNLSALGDKDYNSRLMYSSCSYENFIERLEENNPGTYPRAWFKEKQYSIYYKIYNADVVMSEFNEWVNNL